MSMTRKTARSKRTLADIRRARKISSSGADEGVLHREDFTTCPGCWDCQLKHDEWMKRAVTLVIEPRIWKSGCIAVISECPKCFELSWVHQRFSSIYWDTEIFPADWRNRVRKHSEALKLQATEEFQKSVCKGCRHLDGEPTLDQPPVWRSCLEGGCGTGPIVKQGETCPKFKPKK